MTLRMDRRFTVSCRAMAAGSVLLLALCAGPCFLVQAAQQFHKEYLTAAEIDQLREAQEINDRVPLYLEFAQVRLNAALKLAGLEVKEKAPDRRKNTSDLPSAADLKKTKSPPKTITDYLEEFSDIYDEMLRHLDERLDARDDVRKALKAITKDSPAHLAGLKALQEKLADSAPDNLSDALTDTEDAIEGSRKTLGQQEEQFKEEKKQKREKNRDPRD